MLKRRRQVCYESLRNNLFCLDDMMFEGHSFDKISANLLTFKIKTKLFSMSMYDLSSYNKFIITFAFYMHCKAEIYVHNIISIVNISNF